MHILVVEDQEKFRSFVQKGLEEQGMAVDAVESGEEAADLIATRSFDLIVLDIMLPGRDGLSVLREMRESGNTVPVILLTARGGVNERVEGLDLGADDYLPKPFFIEELVARIRTVMRRYAGMASNVIELGDLSVNLATREVKRGQRLIELTNREFSLLEFLMRSPGRVISRTQVCEHVWDCHHDPSTNLVDVYIRQLRVKIDEGEECSLIHTVRGVGYKMEAL